MTTSKTSVIENHSLPPDNVEDGLEMLESDLVLVLAASASLYPVDEFYPVDEGNEDASPTSLESLVAVESSSFFQITPI